MVISMDKFQEQFDELYLRHAPKLYKVAFRILLDDAAAKDLVQNTFLLLLNKKAQGSLSWPIQPSWLYITLKNLIGNELQNREKHPCVPLETISEVPTYDTPNFSLEDLLPSALPDEDRELLLLFYEDDLPHSEISKKLGISETTCRSKLFRAKHRLKKNIRKIRRTCNEMTSTTNNINWEVLINVQAL